MKPKTLPALLRALDKLSGEYAGHMQYLLCATPHGRHQRQLEATAAKMRKQMREHTDAVFGHRAADALAAELNTATEKVIEACERFRPNSDKEPPDVAPREKQKAIIERMLAKRGV